MWSSFDWKNEHGPVWNGVRKVKQKVLILCLICLFLNFSSGTVDSIFGPTKNVWSENFDNPRIAGGSSGGSAVAVASGLCFG